MSEKNHWTRCLTYLENDPSWPSSNRWSPRQKGESSFGRPWAQWPFVHQWRRSRERFRHSENPLTRGINVQADFKRNGNSTLTVNPIQIRPADMTFDFIHPQWHQILAVLISGISKIHKAKEDLWRTEQILLMMKLIKWKSQARAEITVRSIGTRHESNLNWGLSQKCNTVLSIQKICFRVGVKEPCPFKW
jgi:hypothetical protein